ncbi:hypothetical protein D3C75_1387910 [compost metagenome]
MENCVVVEAFTAVVQEVFNRNGCFVSKSFYYDVAVVGVESDHINHPAYVDVCSQ